MLEKNILRSHLTIFFSIILIILCVNFSHPSILKHFYKTFTNRDYTLSNVKHGLDINTNKLLKYINIDKNTPIYFIEKNRYLSLVNISYNYDTNNINKISNKILFPFYPPSTVITYDDNMINIFKERWLKRVVKSNFNESYVILPNNYHWSKRVQNLILDHNNLYKISFFDSYNGYDIYKLSF